MKWSYLSIRSKTPNDDEEEAKMLSLPPQHTVDVATDYSVDSDAEAGNDAAPEESNEAADEIRPAEIEDLTARVDPNETPPNDQSAATRFVMCWSSYNFNIFDAVVCMRVSKFNFNFQHCIVIKKSIL